MAKSWLVVPAVLLLTVVVAEGSLFKLGLQSFAKVKLLSDSLTANAIKTGTNAAKTKIPDGAGVHCCPCYHQCSLQALSEISTAVDPRVLAEKQKIKEKLEDFNLSKNWTAVKQYLETLLDHDGPGFRQLQAVSQSHPMYSVSTNRFVELVTLLVIAGHGANLSDSNGNTMLHGATDSGFLKLVEFLLKHGANPNQRNVLGFTPLMRATWWNHLDVARLLLAEGADASSADYYGETSLHHAAYWGNLDMVKLLVCAGANTRAVRLDGTTPIASALSFGHVAVAEYLSCLPH